MIIIKTTQLVSLHNYVFIQFLMMTISYSPLHFNTGMRSHLMIYLVARVADFFSYIYNYNNYNYNYYMEQFPRKLRFAYINKR